MSRLLRNALLIALVAGDASAQPRAGSKLPVERNTCATCHGAADLWEGETQRLHIASEPLADDVHWKSGVNCHDCHGGNAASFNVPEAHSVQIEDAAASVLPFRPALSEQARSLKRLEAQIQTCGHCHQQAAESYLASVHGHGLRESGLAVTAACTDCHGSHGIYSTSDARSKLHSSKVSETCATCHQFIHERVRQSIHGSEVPAQAVAQEPMAGSKQKPSCIDCHQAHDLPHPRSADFRLTLPHRCGNCHNELSSSYTQSLHGKLTELGYVPAATCSDCHGSHDIVSISSAESPISAANRRQTCAKCHTSVTANFVDFDPHADASNAQRDPVLYWIDRGLTAILIGVFSLFGMHSLLWLVRSWIHVRSEGRPPRPVPGKQAYVRFKPVHRAAHTVLMISFLGLALTGLPLRYTDYQWAHALSGVLGGFQSTGLWHRLFGVANIGCLVFYCAWFGGQFILGPGIGRKRFLFGPDSPVPNRRDLRDIGGMLRWFVGRGPKPTFERWTYWEKFDIWAACADITLIGSTGLVLWFPNQFCTLLPGQALNFAAVIHGKLALLATGFIFTIHFFNTHLRAEKFPMDMSIHTGLVSEEELREERPELVERLKMTGSLDQYRTETPSRATLLLTMLGGFIAVAIGLALLVGILIAVFDSQ